MKITSDQITEACNAASSVYDGKLTPEKAAKELHEKYGLNINSARDFIGQYSSMMHGEVFKRALSAPAIDYFLSHIEQHRGRSALETSLVAAWKHLEYYEAIRGTRLGKFRSVLQAFQSKLTGLIADSILESNFAAAVDDSLNDTSAARNKRLQSANKVPLLIIATTKVYARNPDVVAEVLFRAKGYCEKCKRPAPFKKKKDGKPYLEVHHKVQLSDKGEDTVANAIALCPNCHRHQHFG